MARLPWPEGMMPKLTEALLSFVAKAPVGILAASLDFHGKELT
jgi:hypothetical protein